jgi:predicted PurR-regulated permease PerM
MLGLDRTAARWTWTAALLLLLFWSIYEIRETIFVLIVAILFAYMLTPLVDALNRLLPGKSRAPALAVTYLVLLAILVVAVIEIGSRVVEEATSLTVQAPKFFENLHSSSPSLPLPRYLQMLKGDVLDRIQAFLKEHSSDILGYLPTAGMKVLSFSGYLIFLVLVPIISFFLLKDGARIRDSLLSLTPVGARRELWTDIIEDTNVLLGRYVRAVGLLCLNTFIVFSIVFAVMRVPYGILLASIAFPLEFIPMIGPLIAAVLILLVTLATGYAHVFGVLLFLLIYRLVQDYVVSPRLMSAGIEMHPLLVILGVLAGEKLGGVPGMFLSVPAIALVRVLYRRLAP